VYTVQATRTGILPVPVLQNGCSNPNSNPNTKPNSYRNRNPKTTKGSPIFDTAHMLATLTFV